MGTMALSPEAAESANQLISTLENVLHMGLTTVETFDELIMLRPDSSFLFRSSIPADYQLLSQLYAATRIYVSFQQVVPGSPNYLALFGYDRW